MSELPSGTVTFLFTDIENSTRAAEALGDERWADVLDEHRGLLRAAFAPHGGVEIRTEGDAFFVAFDAPDRALAASIDGQLAIERHPWPDDERVRVRMGIHTGEVLVRKGDYVGIEVHRAKRISDAGNGGQILVSRETRDAAARTVAFIDLGLHRLKDLGSPERIFQLTDDRLTHEFPRLRSLGTFTHTLPQQRSAFIGREREIAELRELLHMSRIVTVTGVGGCGKTRLALQVAAEEIERFPDGVFFVDLSTLSDPEDVESTIASEIGARGGGPLGGLGAPGANTLSTFLEIRTTLIVLDNCEHVVDACADVVDRIVGATANTAFLATSREALRLDGEVVWTVPSMTLPSDGVGAEASEAVALFLARALVARPAFQPTPENLDAIAEICRRLDGIPLAIEFAAARVSHLAPRSIAERLDDRFRLLTGGRRRVQRQQTLQAALDWSFDLLDDKERTVLARASVFAGDFGLDAAEDICSGGSVERDQVTDVLASLVMKSLVLAEADEEEEMRYRLLETVRAYAAERLVHTGEAELIRDRHRDWYAAWARSFSCRDSFLRAEAARRMTVDAANARSAIETAEAQDRGDIVATIAGRLRTVWPTGLDVSAHERWLSAGAEAAVDADDRTACLIGAAWMNQRTASRSSVDLIERAVDESTDATPALRVLALESRALIQSVIAAFTRDEDAIARLAADLDDAAALAAEINDDDWIGFVELERGLIEITFGRFAGAAIPFEKALRRFERSGNGALAAAVALEYSVIAHITGRDDEAVRAYETAQAALSTSTVGDTSGYRAGTMTLNAAMLAITKGTDAARAFIYAERERWQRASPTGPGSRNWFVVEASVAAAQIEDCVLACAILDTMEGRHRRAAVALSWLRATTLDRGIPPHSRTNYAMYVHYRDLVRGALGPQEARAAKEEGTTITTEGVLALVFPDD